MENRFNIDFFEFAFLVEATIPPVPIARTMFWDKVINYYYHVLTEEERAHLFKWIAGNPYFDRANEDCDVFYARYDPENQYRVTCFFEKGVIDCFKFGDEYYTSKDTFIDPKYIAKVTRINSGQ